MFIERDMKKPVYLDYAATTPLDKRIVAVMQDCLTLDDCFGNPASASHCYGQEAYHRVANARMQVAQLINADPKEIIFTSGATESNNLALKGVAYSYQEKGKHIITCKTEHKAVLDSCKFLEKAGFEITYLTPNKLGLIPVESVASAIRADTILVSIMHVNNEIGVIQDIANIGYLCRERGVLFHVDAAQSAGKLPIDLQTLAVDLMSFSAHKCYGPKGIGALFVRRKPRVRLQPLFHGGGHEEGLRSGTLATHQIVGMGEAFAIAALDMAQETARVKSLRDNLWKGINKISGVHLNGDWENRVANNLNFHVKGVEGEALLMALKDLAISTGSACSSATIEPSYVLKAIGLSDQLAHSSLRVSLGRFTTEEDVNFAIDHIVEGIQWLRSLSPVWVNEEHCHV